MVQQGAAIFLSLFVILLAFIAAVSNGITPGFQWTFIFVGALEFAVASWGVVDYITDLKAKSGD